MYVYHSLHHVLFFISLWCLYYSLHFWHQMYLLVGGCIKSSLKKDAEIHEMVVQNMWIYTTSAFQRTFMMGAGPWISETTNVEDACSKILLHVGIDFWRIEFDFSSQYCLVKTNVLLLNVFQKCSHRWGCKLPVWSSSASYGSGEEQKMSSSIFVWATTILNIYIPDWNSLHQSHSLDI